MKPLKNVGLLAFDRRKAIADRMREIASDPSFKKVRFFGCKGNPVPTHPKITLLPIAAFLKKIDAAVSFGGDGTFISAARLIRESRIPIVGVNMGTLGFLTEIPVRNSHEALKEMFAGKYVSERRMTFHVDLVRKGKCIHEDTCLNDVVIKGSKLIRLSMLQEKEPVSAFNADGLIVSTPTGSTAYSLAAGGPIVDPTLDCVIVTPLCSHSLTQKPVVTGIRKSLTVCVDDPDVKAELTIDGKICFPIRTGDRITISRSNIATTILRPRGSSYFDILRRKLNWG
ncbi:MAG: NAD(+)/NADH kinase [Fibrobacteres bacterium]|nr:NAD(+)/NADH kinase [Fibrobacterota bacterium]